MTPDDGRPDPWSYGAAPNTTKRVRVSRRAIWIAIAVVAIVSVVAGALVWSARPKPPQQAQTDLSFANKPMLNDKPPTLIKSAIQPRSLYPPGYVDFDESKADPNRGQPPAGYDKDAQHTKTSNPPGCEDNPLLEDEFNFNGSDPDRYAGYPVFLIINPVDDAGTLGAGKGFSVSVYPAKDPKSLSTLRDWFTRCKDAQITRTTTKDGRVIDTSTTPMGEYLVDAPSSVASDSFARNFKDRDICDYYGLVRGLIVNVTCPPNEKEAGAQLFRTVVLRLWNA